MPVRQDLPVVYASAETGLNALQVEERVVAGYRNEAVEPPTKSTRQIILTNVFSFFNIVFFILAACVIAVGSWNNLTFMTVVLANMLIGIVQELRSKKTLDKLTLLVSPTSVVVREGETRTARTDELVRDDVVIFAAGDQIYADAVVLEGDCQVNEGLVTGEADEIRKTVGDMLLSGSFLVSGTCHARLTAVGADSYVSRLTMQAKKYRKNKQSEMMLSLTRIILWIGIILLPFGAILAVKEIVWLGRSVTEGVVSTVGALIGMIPEGLYLLTTMALVAGVLRLIQRKTLVHDLSCIETLARVDMLCVDKTGTITEDRMTVEDLILLSPERFNEGDIRLIMTDYVYAMRADNETMTALFRHFEGQQGQAPMETLPFSSSRKYGGVSFHPEETYLLGAPDVLLDENYTEFRSRADSFSERGLRVLLLALYDGSLEDKTISAPLLPLAFILLANRIRPEAPKTFAYFAKQGVAIKVISGDNVLTVSEVAKRAGIENAEKYVDARTLDSDRKIQEAAGSYTVFGRVTPEQKRKLIRALKAQGHTVAMTGDGVNDILALKEADCSVAMASGSDVASRVSHIVLLDSNFSSMPSVVLEGRRVINNIERSASLFLVKNIFSFSLALISLFFTLPYPLTPSQLSLVSVLTIGIPSFVLALEPNKSLVKGRFLANVLYRAVPAALTDLALILGVLLFGIAFQVDSGETSTICAMVMATVGLIMLHRTSKPYNLLRTVLMGAMILALIFSVLFLKGLFTLSKLDFSSMLVLTVFVLLAFPTMRVMTAAVRRISEFPIFRAARKRRSRAV
jgi:cation-transporting ATPase E